MKVARIKSLDISGMGGRYEAACQGMLRNGIEFIRGKPLSIWKGTHSYKNIYGILITESPELKKLEKIWIEKYEPSGAMHQAVMSHLRYIHEHGYEAWLELGKKKKRLIEIEV